MKSFWNLMDLFFTLLIMMEDDNNEEGISIGHIL